MNIKSLRLERFRAFEDTTIEFSDFNLLVGANNCGKTTVLHAIRAFFSLMRGHVRFEGDPPSPKYHRRFLSTAEEITRTPEIRELWYNQQAGKPAKITVTFDDDTSFTVVLRYQFGQIHVSAEGLPDKMSASDMGRYINANVAFIPGLVGVLVREPYSTAARRDSLASQGRYSEIFRSSIQQLKLQDRHLIDTINESLEKLFGVRVATIEFDGKTDEFVTVQYEEDGGCYDVVSSGAGLQQVIQLLTYLYLKKPNILLIDEPDAHLHSRLQAGLGALFRKVARDLDAQVFLSTHSLDLIDTFRTNNVIIIDSDKSKNAPIGESSDLTDALVGAGIVDASAVSRLLFSHRLVVVEDEDISILKGIDKAIGSPLFSSTSDAFVKRAKGVGNFTDIKELAKTLRSLISDDFEIIFIQDRDGLPDFMVDPYLSAQDAKGMEMMLLDRHEIENYLVDEYLIRDAMASLGVDVDVEELKELFVEAGNKLRPRAQRICLNTAKQANRFVSNDDRKKERYLEELVYEWFDGIDDSSYEEVVSVWPGKELLKEVRKMISEKYDVDVTVGRLIAVMDEDNIPDGIADLLFDLAGSYSVGVSVDV